MGKWYRVLVVFTLGAMICCTTFMAFACVKIWKAGDGTPLFTWEEDRFHWSNEVYDLSGRVEDGCLLELHLEKTQLQ